MGWLKKNWFKTLQYIFIGFVLYICGSMIYLWLDFKGSVIEKLILLPFIIIIITLFTEDFRDNLIKWLKKTFKN